MAGCKCGLAGAAAVLLLAACTPAPRGLSWSVAFEVPSLEARAVVFEAVVTEGDCAARRSATALYADEFLAAETPSGPSVLTPGTYAFSIRARDARCQWFAGGCTTETLPEVEGHETLVVLVAILEEAACPDDQCIAGACVTSPPIDVGSDGLVDTGTPDTPPMDTGVVDTGTPDTALPDTRPPDTGSPDTFVPECANDSDCGSITYSRAGSWSCRTDGALDRAPFDFTIPECNSGRCGARVETHTLECRCRDDICSSAGCNDVVDSSTRCDRGGVEGECPNPAAEGECHR